MFYFTYLLNTVNTNSVLNLSIYNDKLIYNIDQGNKKFTTYLTIASINLSIVQTYLT